MKKSLYPRPMKVNDQEIIEAVQKAQTEARPDRSPSVRSIAEGLGLALFGVQKRVAKLVSEGRLIQISNGVRLTSEEAWRQEYITKLRKGLI